MNEETQQAFNMISNLCTKVQGTLEDHQRIQSALAVLKTFLEAKKENAEDHQRTQEASEG